MLTAFIALICTAAPAKPNVISAVYGSPDDPNLCRDVTSTVKAVLKDPYPRIVVTNQEMGRDPAPDERKQFRLYYTDGAKDVVVKAEEGETIRIKVDRFKILIRSAQYGVLDSQEKSVDVTEKVSDILFDKRFRFVATPNELGVGDPAPGVFKKLMITYTVGGQRYSSLVDEYKTFFFDPAKR